jgi:phosphatidylserine decarboxylase
MAKPLPLPVWDRQRGKLIQEWMDDHQPHYESDPQGSFTQWIKSQPLYDRLYALYENSRWSTREIHNTRAAPATRQAMPRAMRRSKFS